MKISNFYILLYIIFLIIYFFIIGLPALSNIIDFQFYADTPTYYLLYESDLTIAEIFRLSSNLLGPILILNIFQGNYFLIFALNVLIFIYCYKEIVLLYNLDKNKYIIFLIICPLMLGSLMGVNKEIFSLLVITMLLKYSENKSFKFFIYAIIFSIFVRWQLSVVVLVYFFSISWINPLKNKRWMTLLAIVILISIIYPIKVTDFEQLEHVNNVAEIGGRESTEGSGLYTRLIEVQNKIFGYVFVVVPKALQLLVGLIFRWYKFFDFSNVYNNVFMFLQSIANLFLLVLCYKRGLNIKNNIVFLLFTYIAIFSISPIYTPRYLFPAYFLMAIYVSFNKSYVAKN